MSAIIEKPNSTEKEQKEYDELNPNKYGGYSLHGACLAIAPISWRLSWASEAIVRGCDVNELDGIYQPLRPLHAAIENPGDVDYRTGKLHDRFESLEMVQFLLAHGADPRLQAGQAHIPKRHWLTPMDVALSNARYHRESGFSVYRFWEEARDLMIEAAKNLTVYQKASRRTRFSTEEMGTKKVYKVAKESKSAKQEGKTADEVLKRPRI
ncbi:hypothetical protein DL765_001277 [Monosporascus sp. GIB2]|nr:hypothetical protein DL765_001277 [Monosporascus sp. GIB2]